MELRVGLPDSGEVALAFPHVGLTQLPVGKRGVVELNVWRHNLASNTPEEQLEYFYGFPAWTVSAWAIAVWIGLMGTVGLLMRRKWSFVAYVVSLAGLAISSIYTLFLSNGLEIMGSTATFMTVVIWVISIFLIWYSRQQAQAGVLS